MSSGDNSFEQLRNEALTGTLSRRSVLQRGVALGLSAPALAGLLAACGSDDDDDSSSDGPTPTTSVGSATEAPADDETAPETEAPEDPGDSDATAEPEDDTDDATPEESGASSGQRGGGGQIRLLYWQAPTILNPHLAQGTKDWDACRVCMEPLIELDDDLNPIFYLAVEPYPSIDNGMLAEDGTWVRWNLRQGVKWHDGEDFNAEDVKFTFDWIASEGNSPTTIGFYENVESVDIIDDYTVQVNFKEPDPVWFDPFRARTGLILPEHIYRDYMGDGGREAPANLKPIGTGPFKVTEFRPGDVVLYDIHEDYWEDGKPFFDSVELKGGGDAAAAARAVLQTGEGDWAWNVQVEPAVLNNMLDGGYGELSITPGASGERVLINFADPYTEVDGAFAEPGTEHPLLNDVRLRQALDLTIPRDIIKEQLFGEGDIASAHYLPEPAKFASPNITWDYDPDAARALLDEAGFEGGNLLYQTTISPVRQRTQEVLKAEWEKLGFTVDLKAIESSVFFSSDAGNPDTVSHFYADLEMYNTAPTSPLPITHLKRWHSSEIAQKSNNWSGANYTRYNDPQVDAWIDELASTLDEDRQVELIHQITEKIRADVVEMTIVTQSTRAAKSKRIGGHVNYVWQSNPMPQLKNWVLNE